MKRERVSINVLSSDSMESQESIRTLVLQRVAAREVKHGLSLRWAFLRLVNGCMTRGA